MHIVHGFLLSLLLLLKNVERVNRSFRWHSCSSDVKLFDKIVLYSVHELCLLSLQILLSLKHLYCTLTFQG